MNYGELRSQFVSLLNRRDLTPTLRDTFLQQALARIQRSLRIPAMEKRMQVTVGPSTPGLVVPNDCLQLKTITAGATELEQRDIQTVLQAAVSSGQARYYARRGGLWLLGPTPQAGDLIYFDYYAEFAPLAADADTNVLAEIAPDLILYTALVFGCTWALDERKDAFEAAAASALSELQNQAMRDELPGASAMSPVYAFPED